MNLQANLKTALRALIRRRSPVQFGDLSRVAPISHVFGLDRGTPIDRYYIDKYIAQHKNLIHGRALEVGETRYLSVYGPAATEKKILVPREDVAKEEMNDGVITGDLANASSLPENEFDCFVCTQTLNFIYDVAAAIRGAHHLLAPGGIFLGTVSGISQISRYDMDRWGDYWRFTDCSLKKMLTENFGDKVEVECMGNALAAQALLQGAAIEDLPNLRLLDQTDKDYQVTIGFTARKAA